MISRRLLW